MANALAREKSPYLLQHADNPVDWLPWGETAWARARTEQKPIFLSIGYSTCHWCHVMAHESFESADVAAVLNEHFVSIKVDREERPDVDRVYMTYVQALTGHGGWPLSAFLTPDLKPFYGGTYFPPDDRQGRPGFVTLLSAIAKGWANEREKLVAEGDRVIEALRTHYAEKRNGRSAADSAAGIVEDTPAAITRSLFESGSGACEKGFQYYYEAFDAQNGGFGGAPKFPRASNLSFLVRLAVLQGPESELWRESIKMVGTTLREMAQGGVHDQLGGGFHRYSVDDEWFVPHFEKMLYDQAQIAVNCLDARQATGDERFAWLARDIFAYVRRDLTHPAGAFYSAEDADSETPSASKAEASSKDAVPTAEKSHAEGAFYVWTKAEIESALGTSAALFCEHFDVQAVGNVPSTLDPHGEFRGKNILRQRKSLAETARAHGLTLEQANENLLAAIGRLLELRNTRPRPHLDDKIITAWNGLMISAFARGAQVLGDESCAASATHAAEFIHRELYDEDRGVLFRSYREGRSMIEAFAADYACLIQGLIDLYEATFAVKWLQWAVRLQEKMDELFWDEDGQGYFDSVANEASLVLRLKEDYDGAEPAPNSVAAMNLLRLATLVGRDEWRDRGRRTIDAFRSQWSVQPQALPQMLCALELALDVPRHVVLAGDPHTEDFRELAAVLHERLGPRRALLAADGGDGQRWLAERNPWMTEMMPRDGRATAYVCEEFACQAPVNQPAELRRLLAG